MYRSAAVQTPTKLASSKVLCPSFVQITSEGTAQLAAEPMMFLSDPNWTDMSDFVVHFTKPSQGRSDYDNMLNICWARKIKALNPFGIAKNNAPNPDSQQVVCFSEIPLHRLARLAEKRGQYAIGFTKTLLVGRGGGPVLYAYKDTPHHSAIRTLIKSALKSSTPENAAVWKLTPFIDAPGKYGKSNYYFEWEREWRHVGSFSFKPSDVSFLVIPEKHHGAARSFFDTHRAENSGPAYLCPYLDITWNLKRIRKALCVVN